jgi:hypothetical protein
VVASEFIVGGIKPKGLEATRVSPLAAGAPSLYACDLDDRIVLVLGDATTCKGAGGVRVSSLSAVPSITDMLNALDLGERVFGLTTYCHFPPPSKLKVGTYAEAIGDTTRTRNGMKGVRA